MSNPFLFDEPEEATDNQAEAYSNPFLQEATGEDEYVADNPFLSQPAKNPFFGNDADVEAETIASATVVDKQQPEQIDTAMSFFGTTITDTDEDDVTPHPVVEESKKAPPQRPSPPACPAATQELISSLADHLDQTSTHLLDRIPVTRTPSPVSMRDLHSPSPTPEVADLLDVGETVNQDDGLLISDDAADTSAPSENPFVEFDKPAAAPARAAPPPRPTPPRPTPPRPSPPSQAPAVPAAPATDADLFDVFGTNTVKQQQNVPKSNQDILSLFSAPKVPTTAEPQDLLTSDIFTNANTTDNNVVAAAPLPNEPPKLNETYVPPEEETIVASEQTTIAPVTTIQSEPIESHTIESQSPPAQQPAVPASTTNNITINPALGFTTEIDNCESLSDNSSAIGSTMSRTPEVATPFYVPGGYIENRGQSPVNHGDIAYAYQDESTKVVASAATNNPFGSPEQPAIPAIINHHVEPLVTNTIINRVDDEFDAFSAKFNSATNVPGDAFSSGYKSPAPPADGKFFYYSLDFFLMERLPIHFVWKISFN